MADKSYKLAIEIAAKDAASKALGGIGKSLKSLAGIAAGAFAAVKVADLGREAIAAAGDLSETVSKVGVVFGEEADAVLKFGDSAATAMGMTKNEALAAAGVYGNLFRAMGITEKVSADMSTSLLGLASDLASFNNMDPNVVLDKLRAGLSGETEPLKTLGVNLTADAVKAKAMAMGIARTTKELSASAKAQATYALIMEQTSLAQGDFARTSGGLANQQRILAATVGNLKATIGTALLPVVTKVVSALAGLATKAMPVVERIVAHLTPAFEKLGGAFSKVQGAAKALFDFFSGKYEGYQALADLLGGTGMKAGGVKIVMDALLGIRDAVATAWDWISRLPALFQTIAGAIGFLVTGEYAGGLKGFIDGLSGLGVSAEGLGPAVGVLKVIRQVIGEFATGISEAATLIGQGDFTGAIAKVGETLKTVGDTIATSLGTIDWAGIWETVKTTAINVATTVWSSITGLADTIWTGIKNAFESIKTFVSGIDWAGVWETVKTTAINVATTVWGTVSDIADKVWTWISGGIDSAKTLISSVNWADVWLNVKTFLLDAWSGITSAASDIATKVGQWFTDAKAEITTKIESAITGVDMSGIPPKIADQITANKVDSITTALAENVTRATNDLSGKLSDAADAFAGKVDEMIVAASSKTGSSETAKALGDGLLKVIGAAQQAVADNAEKDAESFGKILGSMLRLAFSKIPKEDIEEPAKTFNERFIDALARSIGTTPENLKILGDSLRGLITGFIEGIMGEAWMDENSDQIGKAIVDGIITGIESKADEIATRVENWVNKNISEPIRRFFGIKSPSTLMISYGEDISGGIAIGIENGTPEIAASMQKIVSSISKAFKDLASAFHQMNKVQKTEGGLPDLELWANALKETLIRFGRALEEAKKELTGKVLNNAVAMASKVENLFEVLKSFASTLNALNEVEAIPDMGPFGAALKQAIVVTASAILEASQTLGEKGLQAAAKLSDDAQEVLGLIGPAVQALASMANVVEVADLRGKGTILEEAINVFVYYVWRTANFWKDVALDKAMEFSEAAQKVIGLISPAVQALAGFIDFPAVGNLREKSAFLEEAINLFVYYVWRTAVFWRDVGLDAAALFAETATRVVTIITPAVEALASIGTLGDIDEMTMRHRMAIWETGVNVVVYHIKRVADFWEGVALDSAATFAEVVAKVIGVIKPTVDSLAALAEYKPVANIAGMLDRDNPDNIFSQLDQLLTALRGYALNWGATAEDITAKFAELQAFVGPVVEGLGLIKPVVDAIAAIAVYAPAENLASMLDRDNPNNIFSQLDQILTQLKIYAGNWGVDADAVAANFAVLKAFVAPVVEGLGLIKPVIDAIAAIASYEAVNGLATKIINFANDLDMVLRGLKAISELWVKVKEDGTLDDAVLAAISLFSTNVQSAVSFIKPAIEAVETLAKYKAAEKLAEKMTKFTNDVIIAVGKIREMALNPALGADTLALATAFATDLGKLTSTMSSAITGLGQVLSYKGYSASKAMGALQQDIDKMLIALGQIVANLDGVLGVEKAEAFEAAMRAIYESITAGLGYVISLSGTDATTGAAGALEAFSKAAVQSMKDALKAVDDGLLLILAAFTNKNTQLYQAAYTAGKAIGNGIMAGMRAALNVGTGGGGTSVTTNNSNTYNITQTGAAQTPNSLRTTVTALQMAGTA